MPSNFPDVEKVLKVDFFFQSHKCFISEFFFSFWTNVQFHLYVYEKSFFPCFLRSLLIIYLIILSLIKQINVLKKVWKKSWIFDPRICMSPVNRWRTKLHTWMGLHKGDAQSYFHKIPISNGCKLCVVLMWFLFNCLFLLVSWWQQT